MAGFWPYSFLYVHGPRCSPTQRTQFFYCAERVMLSRPDSPILPSQVGNHSPEFVSSWLISELASHIRDL